MTDKRATCWSVTINNPTPSDEEWIAQARQRGWKVEGQKEVGKEGTPHYQLMVKTPQVRFSAVKKAFPRAHIEVARNVAALEVYVHKAETKVEEMRITSDKYPSQAKVFSMFADWIDDDDGVKPGRKGGCYSWAPETWLKKFEQFVDGAIREGYYLEGIAVNPQTLAIVKRYGLSLYFRAKNEKDAATPPQTDRQTDSQECHLEEEYNNASCSSSSSVSSPSGGEEEL